MSSCELDISGYYVNVIELSTPYIELYTQYVTCHIGTRPMSEL